MAIIRLQGAKEKANGVYFEVDSASTPIGEGGMGKVYIGKSVNTRTGATRPVAIKFMFMDLPEQAIERARREAAIQLRNDNLIEMLGFIETDEQRENRIVKHYHVVSELLHGVSLADILDGKCEDANGNEIAYARKLLNDFTKSPDHFAKIVIKSVLSGLMALHDAGYIHRDIDPSNIMITDDEHIKLIDFGICKQMKNLTTNDKALTVAGAFMGKPEYASPELALGDLKSQNQTTDIYAVGILLYQCIVGHIPFDGTRYQVLDKQLKEKVPVKNIANKELRRIVQKACEKKQENRYQTSAEMRVDIESIDVKRAADPRKKRIIGITVGLVLLAVIGSVVGFNAYNAKVEREHAELAEKNHIDSLVTVVNTSVKQAAELAAKGYMHDEGFDKQLVEAMALYNKADVAASQLKGASVSLPNYDVDKDSLKSSLLNTKAELEAKAEMLEQDPDPLMVAEGKLTRERINKIGNILNTK